MNGTSPCEPLRITTPPGAARAECGCRPGRRRRRAASGRRARARRRPRRPRSRSLSASVFTSSTSTIATPPLRRLTFGERDAHRAVLELRPLVVPVDERLVEPEHALVEVATPVEVADEVPDPWRSCWITARGRALRRTASRCAGSRRPSAPSTARWSTVSVIVIIGRITTAPSRATGVSTVAPTARIAACGGLSTATNCSMPNMPRFEIVNVPSSRSCVVSLLSRARPTIVAAGRRDLGERQPLDGAQDRHDEPLRRGDGDADVRGRELQQRVLGVLHVHVAVAHQRLRAHLREQVGDGDAHVRVQLARARDELVRARHVGADRQLEDRRLPRGGQPARDRLADVRQRDRLDLAASARPRAPAAARRPRARSTSSATMRPSGPVPRSDESSMPRSRAMRRASGEALMRPPFARWLANLAAAARHAQRASRRCSALGVVLGAFVGFSAAAACRALGACDFLALLADPRDRLADRRLALRRARSSAARRRSPTRPPASPCRCRSRRAARPSRPCRPRTSATS